MQDRWEERTRRKWQLLSNWILKEHPYEEWLNGVGGKKSTTKRISLMWAYGKHLKIKRWQPATNENNWLDWDQQGDEKLNSSEW